MKVAQNDETYPNTQPVRPPHIPNLSNSQLSPSGSSVRKREIGDTFPDVSPLRRYHLLPRLGTPSITLCHVMHRHAFVWIIFIVSSPLLSLDSETDAAATQYDYGVDDPSLLLEQPGNPPPFDHQISPTLLYTACIRVV